jgi:iron-sulfur cluster protein
VSSDRARAAKAARIRDLLDTEGPTVSANARHLNDRRYDAIDAVGEERYDDLRDTVRTIKEDAIDRLPELLDTLRESVEANGGHLYVADDAADANDYVTSVCDDVDAESVVKSKSMTTEEIEVNEALEAAGIDVHETDLGELVIQVAEETPSHLIGPGFHKSREEIAALFNEQFEPEEPLETADELTAFARDYLAERIREADVGMTGANFVVAETGTIALVTNEGNARKVVESTNHHVAVTGIEKILPTLDSLRPFVELIGRTATGQSAAIYNTLISGPVNSPPVGADPDAATDAAGEERTFHLVLIDNGRLAMRDDPDLRETLYCIRCGACNNSCANFQSVGGHAFGGETYTGGIGTGWEAGVHGLESASDMNDLCTGCSRCQPACPVKIDIPWINTVVRDRLNGAADADEFDFLVDGLVPDAESGGMDPQKRFFGNFPTLAKLGSLTAPLSNWVAATDTARSLMDEYLGVDARRDLPRFRRETLVDWFAERDAPRPSEPTREAVLYPDPYTNHVATERGKAAVRTLEALGVDVAVPALPPSGRAPLSQGMVSTAEDRATALYEATVDHLSAGRDLVVVEPSTLAMFRSDYEHLLPADRFDYLRSNSYEVMEYVFGLLENGADADALAGPRRDADREVAYHAHCQQRTLGLADHTVAVLDRLGYDVATTDVECCGMAGSFGYKSEYYELSMDVGARLQSQLQDERGRRVLASGTSCTDQIDSLLDREPTHPVELVAPR